MFSPAHCYEGGELELEQLCERGSQLMTSEEASQMAEENEGDRRPLGDNWKKICQKCEKPGHTAVK